MELTKKIKQLFLHISKFDKNFNSVMKEGCEYEIEKIDDLLYRNIKANIEDDLIPLDTTTKKMHYVMNLQHKIYIWLWLDKKNCIAEIEFFDMDDSFETGNILDFICNSDVKVEIVTKTV